MIEALLAAALVAAPAPAKLIVESGQAIAITDYPSMERCERAQAALLAAARAKAEAAMPGGYKVISLGISAYCIPG